MNPAEFEARVRQIGQEAESALAAASDLHALESARTEFLGRKSGKVTELLKELPRMAPDQRRDAGALVNALKTEVEGRVEARRAELSRSAAGHAAELDLTMPGRAQWRGAKHPVTLVIEQIEAIFRE